MNAQVKFATLTTGQMMPRATFLLHTLSSIVYLLLFFACSSYNVISNKIMTAKRVFLKSVGHGARRRIHCQVYLSSTTAMIFLLVTIGLLSTVSECFSVSSSSTTTQQTPYFSSLEKGVAIIAGSTGYIGRNVVRESVRQGYKTVALVRDIQKVQCSSLYADYFHGAQIVECDVTDPMQVLEVRI
jgi:NmrA-like family